MSITPCRQLVHYLYKECRETLSFLRSHMSGLDIRIDSILRLCGILILARGYPTIKDLSGAMRRLLFEVLEIERERGNLPPTIRITVDQTNGDLPPVLSLPARPNQKWFAALDVQARQQSYSGHRLTYRLVRDRTTHTIRLTSLAMRTPKAVDGGAFLINRPKTRFRDVIGMDDAKERLQALVRYFRNPTTFQQLETRPNRRILLAGAPGTGKTLLAKAFAGETGLPFFSVSASEITSQKWAGWGGSRLRELFAAASIYRPSIIFLDELDAFGKREEMGGGDAAMDAKSILNTLLVELDGVQSVEDIVVIGATNRPDDLDDALTRPKRFGTRIDCEPLKAADRTSLIRLHLNPQICEGDYEELITYVTMRTAGPFSPAEIEDVVNEAKLTAEKEGLHRITKGLLAKTIDLIVLGKKFREFSPAYRQSVARHEAGHAVCLRALLPEQRIERLTIGVRTETAGLTVIAEDEEQARNLTRDELLSMIVVALAGPISEEATKGHWDTGSGGDLDRATTLAAHAVSDLGVRMGMRGAALRYMTQKGDPWPAEFQESVVQIVERCCVVTRNVIAQLQQPIQELSEALESQEDLGHEEIDRIIGPLSVNRDAIVAEILSSTAVEPNTVL